MTHPVAQDDLLGRVEDASLVAAPSRWARPEGLSVGAEGAAVVAVTHELYRPDGIV